MMKRADFHPAVFAAIRKLSPPARKRVGDLIRDLQRGILLGMPDARPMPMVSKSVYELRVRTDEGALRIFYRISEDAVLVFHSYEKQSQKTPFHELKTARARLRGILQ